MPRAGVSALMHRSIIAGRQVLESKKDNTGVARIPGSTLPAHSGSVKTTQPISRWTWHRLPGWNCGIL